MFIQSHSLPLCKRDINYKYLGKSLSLCGEDEKQIDEFINKYQTLIDQIKLSVLPISLKCSAFNNLALPKILHHFYNTRLSEIRIGLMEKHLVTAVRGLLKLYKSTKQLAIFLPRDHGSLEVKKLSFVYYTTRIAFLVKMLNHDVEKFSFIARESLKLDMKKRNVTFVGPQGRNFLGYELDENGTLKSKTSFGCQSHWVDLLHYTRKMAVNLEYRNDKVIVLKMIRKLNHCQRYRKLCVTIV